jgi:restriction system protein
MIPTQKEIEEPLLQVVLSLGGKAKSKAVYGPLAQKFPGLREDELLETTSSGANKWINRIQWAKAKLVSKGELESVGHGEWKVTSKGRERLDHKGSLEVAQAKGLDELYDDYEEAFKDKLLDRLQSLAPEEFEHFARKLLMAYGFVEVKVTQKSHDGGIDGYGKLRVGLAVMQVAFQCKKWKGNVGRPSVDEFRGTIQGEYEQGVFFATSDFTPEARGASIKKGAVPVILLNGESIVQLMVDKGLGVERTPMYIYYERPLDFSDIE